MRTCGDLGAAGDELVVPPVQREAQIRRDLNGEVEQLSEAGWTGDCTDRRVGLGSWA